MIKFLTLFFLLLIAYIIFIAYPIYEAREMAKKMISDTTPYEQHPKSPQEYILVAGDSTAVGIGSTNPKETIAGRLGQQFTQADIINLGVSGARLKDLLEVINKHKKRHFDLIVLQIGANDITSFTPYIEIEKDLSDLLLICNQMSLKTILLTAGDVGSAPLFHWPLSSIITVRTLSVRTIFMKEAKKHRKVIYIDLFKDTSDDPFGKDIKKYYAPDLFHLTGDGYGIWYFYLQKEALFFQATKKNF